MAKTRNLENHTVCTVPSSPTIPLKRQHESIVLLPVEQLLRQLLLDYRDELLAKDPSCRLEIWFTGGWVRDKLLGVQSMDIDAALSTMTGVQFGEGLETFYSENQGNYTKEAERIQVSSKFKLYKVDKKPEKSKHLETGTAHIFGLDIDFVNLRGETYTEESRNPQMDFATAEEDAFRRDATVNAIFYNVETQQVADFTDKGLDDMAAGIMRTPLDPSQTFMDDPLRVLRLIRFASRLGYTIADDAKQSMKDQRIHAALNAKVSRERIGIEVFKMLNGRDPLMSFQLIYELGLYASVFLATDSSSLHLLKQRHRVVEHGMPWPVRWPNSYRLLTSLLQDTTILNELAGSQEYVWLIAAYAPIAPLRQESSKQAVKDATEALKLTRIHSKLLEESLMHMDDIRAIVDLAATHDRTDKKLVSDSLFPLVLLHFAIQ